MFFSDLYKDYNNFMKGEGINDDNYIESVTLVSIDGAKNLEYIIKTYKDTFSIIQKYDEDFYNCLVRNKDLLCSKGFEDDISFRYEETFEDREDIGLRYNTGKPMMELIEPGFMEEVAKILTFGASKYEIGNWKKFDKIKRFQTYGSLMRHLEAHRKGEKNDPESGLSHLSHIVTNAMFLWWFDNNPLDK